MRRALPRELKEDANPVLTLDISERRFRELFPVRLTRSAPMAEPEPSKGALIELARGGFVVAMYGLETKHATISVPVSTSVTKTLDALFAEVPIRRAEISWAARAASAAVRKLPRVELGNVIVAATIRMHRAGKVARAFLSNNSKK